MQGNQQAEESLKALHDIRGIMERSARFLSLSGWSGVWAGCTALASAALAWDMLEPPIIYRDVRPVSITPLLPKLILLAVLTFVVAFCGAYYFTWRKAKAQGHSVWNRASRQLMWQVAIPLAAGGAFCLAFLYYGEALFIAPACLAFYGLALVNGSKYTLGEVRWLGYCEVLLGCVCLLAPYYGLYFMAAGFGLLHILYGIVMWNKYDKQP